MEENKTTVTETKQEDKGLSQIQPNEKRSWWSIAFIWVGTMICIPMLMVGGIFGGVLTMGSIFWATLIGFAICCTMMILGGIVGSDTGLNATMCSTRAFGMTGANFTMALVIFICEAGWFAVQTATCAVAFNTLLFHLGVEFPFWLSCVIWGVVMFITAVYGVKWMAVLNYIAVPLLVLLCAYGGIHSINTAGWGNIASAVSENLMPLPAAISTVIGLFALGATCNADYTRYCKTRSDVVKATLIGVMPAALLMIMVGAIMSIGTGNYDVAAMFAGLGLPIVAMLVLILATWTTNTGNAYMSGLAACKMFSIKDSKRPLVTMICGVLGVIMAIAGLADFLNTYISILGGASHHGRRYLRLLGHLQGQEGELVSRARYQLDRHHRVGHRRRLRAAGDAGRGDSVLLRTGRCDHRLCSLLDPLFPAEEYQAGRLRRYDYRRSLLRRTVRSVCYE